MYSKIILSTSLVMVFLSLVFSYIYTEVFTKLYLTEISNQANLCETQKNSDFKYVKVLDYNRQQKTARIYCLYKDENKNLQLDLIKKEPEQWEIVLSRKLNSDSNLYWPIYY